LCDALRFDAIVAAWEGRQSPPHVRVETLSDLNYELVSRFERTAGSVTLLDVHVAAGPAVVIACLKGASEHAPSMAVGCGAAPSAETAVTMALEDLALTWRVARETMSAMFQEDRETPCPPHIRHLRYWCNPDKISEISFFLDSDERVELSEISGCWEGSTLDTLQLLVKGISERGGRVVACDLTPPDLAGVGLRAARCIVSNSLSLLVGDPPLGTRRTGQDVASAGERIPHPFCCPGFPL
jgi:hypothetical protein